MSFWTENANLTTDRPYLNSAQKQYLNDKGVKFHVVDILFNPEHEYQGQRTPQWEAVVHIPKESVDKVGKELQLDAFDVFTLGMLDNNRRRQMFEAMAGHINATGERILSELRYIEPRDGGNGFYSLVPPSE